MNGLLELTAEKDGGGRTILSHRHATAPFCLTKPYDHGNCLQVQLQQVGPGIFNGDRVDVRLEVRPGARLMVTSPSALRLLPGGEEASVLRQHIRVEAGGSLEVWPEPLFPHAGARCRQEAVLDLEKGAALFWFEALAPGRDASGERFAWEHIDLQTRLNENGKPLLWERLRGTGEEWRDLAAAFPGILPWTGMLYAYGVGSGIAEGLQAKEPSNPAAGLVWGASRSHPECTVIKFMAANGWGLRRLRTALMELAPLIKTSFLSPIKVC